MIKISNNVSLFEDEIQWQFVRSSGAGGQHLNKVSTAAQLIFDIKNSSLPAFYQQALLNKADHRITKSGKIIIKCQQSRSQDLNRQAAIQQFIALITSVNIQQKKRIATKPTKSSQLKRLATKKQKSMTKSLRQRKTEY